jgi:hypothetical protein
MHHHYENLKKTVGLEQMELYYEDDISDDIFAKIHPDAPFKLSELLKSKLSYPEIKEFVITKSNQLGSQNKFHYADGIEVKHTAKERHDGAVSKAGSSLRGTRTDMMFSSMTKMSLGDEMRKPTLRSTSVPRMERGKITQINTMSDKMFSTYNKTTNYTRSLATEQFRSEDLTSLFNFTQTQPTTGPASGSQRIPPLKQRFQNEKSGPIATQTRSIAYDGRVSPMRSTQNRQSQSRMGQTMAPDVRSTGVNWGQSLGQNIKEKLMINMRVNAFDQFMKPPKKKSLPYLLSYNL